MLISNPDFLPRILYVLGAGFLLVNLRLFFQYYQFTRLRKAALLTWPGPRPPLYRLFLWVGAVLAILIYYKLAVLRLHPKVAPIKVAVLLIAPAGQAPLWNASAPARSKR